MTKTLARIALPAALALAAFGAQAGEGPIDVRVAPAAAQSAPAAATSQIQSAAKATLLPGA
ncbi:MAG: hypothetical protein NTW15_07735 [Burkholderiales bacterium]|nr:hypothetical protein [Burkholderiales bacterium]